MANTSTWEPESAHWLNACAVLVERFEQPKNHVFDANGLLTSEGVRLTKRALQLLSMAENSAQRALWLRASTNPYIIPFARLYCAHTCAAQEGLPCLDAIAATILQGLSSKEFLTCRDTTRRVWQSNRKSMLEHFTSLQEVYSKLMVVRLDLSYGRDYVDHCTPEREIVGHWEALLKLVRKRFRACLVGHVVKFEYGLDRGVHLHVVLLFDGQRVHNDAKIGEIIGTLWSEEITHGLGTFFNGNRAAHKAKMQDCALGVHTCWTAELERGLFKVADYLTKPDHWVRLAVPRISRNLRRSRLTSAQQRKLRMKRERAVGRADAAV